MNSNHPLVCVCIPVYNGAKTIAKTIQSILNQDYPNFEVCICNNLSNDNTQEIIAEFQSQSKTKISVLQNPIKGYAEDNWNFLLANLQTEADYISLFHADDIYENNILSEEIKLIQKHKLSAAFSRCKLIDADGVDITIKQNYNSRINDNNEPSIFKYDQLVRNILCYRNFLITPSCTFRIELLNELKPLFNKAKFNSSSDLDAWLQIAKLGNIGIVPKALINYRITENQGSYIINFGRTKPADFFTVMDAHIDDFDNKSSLNKELKKYNIMKAADVIICGVNLLKQGDAKEAMKSFKKGLKLTNCQTFRTLKYFRIHSYALITLIMLQLRMGKSCMQLAQKIKIG